MGITTRASHRFEKYSLDIVGPLIESESEDKYCDVLGW
jgi:hypothetical protein